MTANIAHSHRKGYEEILLDLFGETGTSGFTECRQKLSFGHILYSTNKWLQLSKQGYPIFQALIAQIPTMAIDLVRTSSKKNHT